MTDRTLGFEDADRCVQCALCLPHCPTYRLTRDESESPRGRLALLSAWNRGEVPLDASLRGALDHCLGCLACEAVCPAEVPYGKLFDRYHEQVGTARHHLLVRLTIWLSHHHASAKRLHLFLAALDRLRILPLLRHLLPGRLHRAAWLIPDPYPRTSAADGARQPLGACEHAAGRVMLLSGCVSSLWMPEAYQAARLLLERWGFVVDVPEQALCCGALARHAGDVETAEILRHELLETIPPSQPVLVLDSGCFGATHAICTLPGRTTQPVYELTAFLDAHCPPDFAPKLARPARVALHVPCTQRSEVRDAHAATRLLARVGQLTLQPLELAHGCCGAAGSYLLRETHMSDTLAATLRSALGEELPDAIVTTNIGCRLQWQSELGRAGLSIPVRHPAEILLGMRSGIGTDGQMTESVGRPAVPYGKA